MGALGDARLASALVLDADVSAIAALGSIDALAPATYVVVVDRCHHPTRYVVLQVGSLGKGLKGAAGREPEPSLRDAVRLDEKIAANVVDIAAPQAPVTSGSVVLQGHEVLGVALLGGTDRGATPVPVPPPPAYTGSGAGRGDMYLGPNAPFRLDGDDPSSGSSPPQVVAPGPVGDAGQDHETPGGSTRRFRAFPNVAGPGSVVSDATFTVDVGFARQAQSPGDTPVIVVAGASEILDFEVQVDGFGFTFPAGVRKPLSIDRDDPASVRVEFEVRADAVSSPVDRTIEVTFSLAGAVVGLAWVDLTVLPDDPRLVPPPDAMPDAAQARGGGSAIGTAETAPDLTVTIRTIQGLPEVRWQFQSPHAVPLPNEQVTTMLPAAGAQAFAAQLMAQLPTLKATSMIDNALRGLGLRVAGAMPVEFWRVLSQVWALVPDEGRSPSLMLITDEPYVPWELAWMQGGQQVPSHFVAANLPQPGVPGANQHLGAVWAIGRWIVPVPQPFGPDRPPSPPAVQMDASTMAVVVGNYESTGIPALPAAVEEAQDLATAYGALPVDVDETHVMQLFDNQLIRDGQPFIPSIVHMAVHGRVGLDAQQYTGIVLRDKRVVDSFVIEGSSLGTAARPFVFLNACQVGTASAVLNSYGGLASSFLVSGARGFVAPLWNVDDDVAKRLSLAFYEHVLEEGVTVGEAVRRMRNDFLADPAATPTATPMAYVFYGHPHLTLSWS